MDDGRPIGSDPSPGRARRGPWLIDGATGTELDRLGVDVSLPLWSARALVDHPGAVRTIHEAYLRAGAEAITTNTFRTNERALRAAGWAGRSGELTAIAVQIARRAVQTVRPGAAVLGSVAPLAECYRPDLAPPEEVGARPPEPMMRRLIEAGVDRLLIETIGTRREAMAAAAVARRLAPGRWIISFCMDPQHPDRLLGGEPLAEVVPAFGDAAAVGANCVPAPRMREAVEALRRHCPGAVAVAAYANVGFADEQGNWISTDAIDPQRYAHYARQWVDAGATIIGGCCGTTPATITAVKEALSDRRASECTTE